MAGKYDNRYRDSSDFKFKNNDPFPKKRMKSTLESDYVKSQSVKKKTAKKVVKKALKKVPGPIGTVARLSDVPRKLSNAAKNTKNLKKYPKTGLASKKEMSAFKKVMDAKSPALKKVFEANKRAAAHKKTRKQSMAKKSIALASTKRRKK